MSQASTATILLLTLAVSALSLAAAGAQAGRLEAAVAADWAASQSSSSNNIPQPPFQFETRSFEQNLDHFDMFNATTFSQRWLVNDTWWQPGNPIFFYTGNEGPIELFAQNTGFMWDIAPKYGALVVFGEHRYFGHSLPFGGAAYKNVKAGLLRWLSSEQALADYARLIPYIKQEFNSPQSPVIAFGGSYGGMLSSWLRIKYPWVVAGSIAASAPILQFTGMTPPQAYNAVITNTFRKANDSCVTAIAKSWDIIASMSPSQLNAIFTPCKPFQKSTDTMSLYNWISGAIAYMTMADYPYPASFLGPMPAWPVKAACAYFDEEQEQTDLSILYGVRGLANIFYNFTGEAGKCFDMELTGPATLGTYNGWGYLACTEMVMPVGQYGMPNDFFWKAPWNLQADLQSCYETYGIMPRPNWIATVYGGKDLYGASNIVFSNGDLDPWSSGGVTWNVSSTVQAIIIENGAHHLDLRESNPADPASVIFARKFHEAHIVRWIAEYNKQH